MADRERIVRELLTRHGKTYAAEVGIDIARNTPAPLFQALCLALLFSARIRAAIAVDAMRALLDRGWTTADHMAQASWEDRVEALNRAGYARFDEKTATMLGDAAERVLDCYDGDLRQLRDEADRDPGRERESLKQVKGIGDVGADIFFREAQSAWPELYPFADAKALEGAAALGLPAEPEALAEFVDPQDFSRLVTALVRMELAGDADDLLDG
jgi:endonuclease III